MESRFLHNMCTLQNTIMNSFDSCNTSKTLIKCDFFVYHNIRVLGKVSQRHPKSAYSVLGMSLQLEWQYLQRNFPGFGTLMGSIEGAKREKCFHTLFWGKEINADFRKVLGHRVKHVGLGILDSRLSAESAYNTSKADSEELIDSLLVGSSLNYVGHKACIHGASVSARKNRKNVEMSEIARQKDLA